MTGPLIYCDGAPHGPRRRLFVLSCLAISIVVFSSAATAAILPLGSCPAANPGDTITPCDATAAPFGTLLASLSAPFTTANGTTSGTLVSAVYQEAGGTLDFYYQVINNTSSSNCGTAGKPACNPLSRATDIDFSTWVTQVAFRTNGHLSGPFIDGTVPPLSADRNSPTGNVIGFSFFPPDGSKIKPGTTSNVLIISTNATNFRAGNAAVIDGSTTTVASFEPTCGPPFSETFDGVTAPALPGGWTTVATGGEVAWVTSTTTPVSTPNDAFAPDVATVGNTELVTPTFAAPAANGTLTFRNLFNLDSGFDGMVLEISINGGAFADIITAGGSFVAGGYTGSISTCCNSPIGARMAWTGLSSGTTAAPAYITTTVKLPAAANGQNVKLKWRMATDSSSIATGTAGVRIDDINATCAP